jgi:hypothetical protein
MNLFIMRSGMLPKEELAVSFLAHTALRLSCNHSAYQELWRDQVGETWREERPSFSWPVLSDDETRWNLRAAVDAVVAHCFGLDRQQYSDILSTFNHKSFSEAPTLCIQKFEELASTGFDAFAKKYDPYWDIPLNESLPKPVIELPGITVAGDPGERFALSSPGGSTRKNRGRRR